MKYQMKRILLTALFLFSAFTMVWADGWKLTGTKVNGTGGRWENGQKTRIDCSYKKGVFQFERKVTNGTKMDVYTSKAIFAEPQKSYAPGENISVRIEFSQKGEKQDYAPYAKVTVNGNFAADAAGRNSVTPPETVTLMSTAPSSGSQMTIVYACNGMEAIYSYAWDGQLVASAGSSYEETTTIAEAAIDNEIVPKSEVVEEETDNSWELESYDNSFEESNDNSYEESYDYNYEEADDETDEMLDDEELEDEDFEEEGNSELRRKIIKLVIVGVIAAILIVLILILFGKKKDKQSLSNEGFINNTPEPMMETPQNHVCPNCGTPIVEGDRFCQGCGSPLTPNQPKSGMNLGITILILVAMLQSCSLFQKTPVLTDTGIRGVKTITLSDMDSKTLSSDETKRLKALAHEIKDMGTCQVTVIGHADNTGTSEVNEAVSRKRAQLVSDYLKKHGVTNITTSWESYNHPVAGNDTASGRAKNRRVEIFVSTVGRYNPYK